ncbi:hypothetical protein CYMTET_3872 [Cymbomonas tetramitiformis]|uniref:Uncharacterized protein n=1 Tax=Cymbomonas tetramitiformis TaxID=36881 RepID=A0AAE0H280_9CHLO|nr:hypothetical protein CYMTET_3872 [Cymbomonas tetramitiformis]
MATRRDNAVFMQGFKVPPELLQAVLPSYSSLSDQKILIRQQVRDTVPEVLKATFVDSGARLLSGQTLIKALSEVRACVGEVKNCMTDMLQPDIAASQEMLCKLRARLYHQTQCVEECNLICKTQYNGSLMFQAETDHQASAMHRIQHVATEDDEAIAGLKQFCSAFDKMVYLHAKVTKVMSGRSLNERMKLQQMCAQLIRLASPELTEEEEDDFCEEFVTLFGLEMLVNFDDDRTQLLCDFVKCCKDLLYRYCSFNCTVMLPLKLCCMFRQQQLHFPDIDWSSINGKTGDVSDLCGDICAQLLSKKKKMNDVLYKLQMSTDMPLSNISMLSYMNAQ